MGRPLDSLQHAGWAVTAGPPGGAATSMDLIAAEWRASVRCIST